MIEKTVSRFITEFKKEYGEDALEIKKVASNRNELLKIVKTLAGADTELFIIKKSGTIHCYSVIWLNNDMVKEKILDDLIQDDTAGAIIVEFSDKIVITYYEIN